MSNLLYTASMASTHKFLVSKTDPIQKLWNLRLDRKLSEFEIEYQKFCAENGHNQKWKNEIGLLEIARLRGQGKLALAQNLAIEIKDQFIDGRWELQMGLNCLASGEDMNAWMYFSAAHEISKDLTTRILALGNKVLCLNHFGLSYKSSLDDLEGLTLSYIQSKGAGASSIQSQNFAQRLRIYFRDGDLRKMRQVYEKNSHLKGQASYLWCWSMSLPYVLDSAEKSAEIQKVILNDPSLNLQQGRIQTVLRIFSPNDELNYHERVDRLYLWVWSHLQSVRQVPLLWLESEIEKLLMDTKSMASAEDLVMLRNIGGWLKLICGRPPVDITASLKNPCRVGEEDYILFKEEWDFINRIYSRVFKFNEKFSGLKFSEIQNQFFEALKDSDFEKHLNQQALLKKSLQADQWHLFTGRDLFVSKKGTFVDPTLALLIQEFQSQTILDFERIAKICFGALGFNQDIHNDLILRLLIKLKKMFPDKQLLKVRGHQVILEAEIPCVIASESPLAQTALSSLVNSFLGRGDTVPSKKPVKQRVPSFLLGMGFEKPLRRKQIEQLTGWSKATTNRKLAEYLGKNWLIKQGSGKQIVYQLNKDLR